MPPWNRGTDTVTPAQVVDHRKLGYRFDTEDYLLPGEELPPFEWLWSAQRGYMLWLSDNGHVRLERDLARGLIWDSGSRNSNLRAGKLVMRPDGNLVSVDPSNQTIWESGTAGNPNSPAPATPAGVAPRATLRTGWPAARSTGQHDDEVD
jgi:hypothetical protein